MQQSKIFWNSVLLRAQPLLPEQHKNAIYVYSHADSAACVEVR